MRDAGRGGAAAHGGHAAAAAGRALRRAPAALAGRHPAAPPRHPHRAHPQQQQPPDYIPRMTCTLLRSLGLLIYLFN